MWHAWFALCTFWETDPSPRIICALSVVTYCSLHIEYYHLFSFALHNLISILWAHTYSYIFIQLFSFRFVSSPKWTFTGHHVFTVETNSAKVMLQKRGRNNHTAMRLQICMCINEWMSWEEKTSGQKEEEKTNNLSLAAFLFIGAACRFRLRSVAAICCPLLEKESCCGYIIFLTTVFSAADQQTLYLLLSRIA